MKEKKEDKKQSLRLKFIDGKDIDFKNVKERETHYIETDPKAYPKLDHPGVEKITIKHGYGFRWVRCEGSWSWFPPTMCGPEGNSPESPNNYNPLALGGALVSYADYIHGVHYYVDYEKKYDTSREGTWIYVNDLGEDMNLHFYINDVLNPPDYADNLGYMNSDIEVFRL